MTDVMTHPSHRARVGDALDLLFRALDPYVEEKMKAAYGRSWVREAQALLHNKPRSRWDTSDLLAVVFTDKVFRDLGHDPRSWVSLLREVRKRWAHQGDLTLDETRRALETTLLFLRAIGAEDEAARLEPHVLELMQYELQRKLSPEETPAWVADARASIASIQGDADAPPAEAAPTLVEKSLDRLRGWLKKAPSEPLELRRALLDAIEHTAEPYRKHFDFNRLVVHIVAEEDAARVRFETAIDGLREPFDRAVRRRLADARIPLPARFNVSVKFYRRVPERMRDAFDEAPFHIELNRRRSTGAATLTVRKGRAERTQYGIKSSAPATLGRSAEVTDDRGRVVWRNTVAFLDYEDPRLDDDAKAIHATISRVHARIEYDDADAVFRLHDEGSTVGTSVVREGYLTPFQVKRQPVALQDGDLIYLGKACLCFAVRRGRS